MLPTVRTRLQSRKTNFGSGRSSSSFNPNLKFLHKTPVFRNIINKVVKELTLGDSLKII
jgi:hypothetical protein